MSRADHPDFAESRHWRPDLAPGSVAINFQARLDARGSILRAWRPFWGHFRFLGPCPSADTLTPCHFIFSVFQQLATILCPLEPHRDSGHGGCHRFEKLPDGCRDMAISMCLAPNIFPRHRESVIETELMSSVETGQMSQQQSSVLSQQQTSVLSQQKTSVLSQPVLALSLIHI